ncbi:hypothetical protein [Peribacillus loiseleuriae]|uniref:hypothetical protein n=1 Tax=Peribacillus loiseleuriae TaxID=1679170 RepID=UPI000A6195D7|nr:hypothetical protein [Peribacillus loiseleuriae]
MTEIDKDKLLDFMYKRKVALFDMYQRDFEGDPSKVYTQYWELKFWLEGVERG